MKKSTPKSPHPYSFVVSDSVQVGDYPFVLIAGPCVVESSELVMETAERLTNITKKFKIPLIFKASFDKANRTSHASFRSFGFESSIDVLERVRQAYDIPVITDVHEVWQVERVAKCVDMLQIPAFLCRQTDLLEACAKTLKPINIKKGQFMAPEDMYHSVEKIRRLGNPMVSLTERGTSFGYHTLVVDMRSLVIMRNFAPVIFDATHSVQTPGGMGQSSGGQREYVEPLARAACAVGVNGFFIETHPSPNQALSDGPNMVPLDEMPYLLDTLLTIHQATQSERGES